MEHARRQRAGGHAQLVDPGPRRCGAGAIAERAAAARRGFASATLSAFVPATLSAFVPATRSAFIPATRSAFARLGQDRTRQPGLLLASMERSRRDSAGIDQSTRACSRRSRLGRRGPAGTAIGRGGPRLGRPALLGPTSGHSRLGRDTAPGARRSARLARSPGVGRVARRHLAFGLDLGQPARDGQPGSSN